MSNIRNSIDKIKLSYNELSRLVLLASLFFGLFALQGCFFFNSDIASDFQQDTASPQFDQNGDLVPNISGNKGMNDRLIGQKEHPKILREFGGVYRHPKAEQVIAVMVGELMQASGNPAQSYDLTILDSPNVNAFALPGGFVYVTRGLLALANDTSEVAAVLAHEMAHVSLNHARQRREHQTSLLINDIASRMDSGNYDPQIAIQARRQLAAFTQRHEFEADQVGIKTLGYAGYDPFAARRFLLSMERFQALQKKLEHRSGKEFLSTHPSTPERINQATRKAREFGAPGIGRKGEETYMRAINGLVYGRDPKNGAAFGRAYFNTSHHITFTASKGFQLVEKDKFIQGVHKNGTAMRFDIKTVRKNRSASELIAHTDIKGLDKNSIRSFTLGGLPAARATATVKGWHFLVVIIREKNLAYQFMFTHKDGSRVYENLAPSTYQSFRKLSAQEAASIKPKRINTIKASASDTFQSLARKMSAIPRNQEHFAVLNNIQEGAGLTPGQYYKIIQ